MTQKKKRRHRKTFIVFNKYFFLNLWYIRHVVIGLLIIVLLCAYLIGRFEGMSTENSIYFTFVTAFTIGFGDITPLTTGGKIISLVVGLIGIIFTGIIVAVSLRALDKALKEEHEE